MASRHLLFILCGSFAITYAEWSTVGYGVQYSHHGPGSDVLIMYAGWSISSTLSRHWVERVLQQRSKHVGMRNIGHVYAVQGPRDVLYNSSEIANSKLLQHLLALHIVHPERILVVAHSSGTYVANEFLSQLHGPNGDHVGQFTGKVIYFNLDGGGGLDAVSRSKVREYFVFGKSGSLYSMNAQTMKSLGSNGNLIEIDGSDSGCQSNKCLHDFMINEHPWNPYNFDLEKDYGLFSIGSHEVQTYYFKWIP